jgi:hypothetical protein
MKKIQAILWALCTIVIAITGLSAYNDGTHYMTWFGIELSKNGFLLLIVAFAISDIFVLKNAFGKDKFMDEMKDKTAETVSKSNEMEIPCTVTLTRPCNLPDMAMGVHVFLNGVEQEVLKDGETVIMQTWLIVNELTVRFNADDVVRSAKFNAISGGNVHIILNYSKRELIVKSY